MGSSNLPPHIPGNSISGMNEGIEKKEKIAPLPDSMKARSKPKKGLTKYIVPEDVPDLKAYWDICKENIINTLIVPNVKNILINAFSIIVGGDPIRKSGTPGEILPKVSYDKQYNSATRSVSSTSTRSYVMYEDLYFPSKESCLRFKDIIEGLFDEQGGYITVLQYMNHAGRPTHPEQQNFGWTSLADFEYKYTVDGWMVKMPYPKALP